MRVVAGTLGGQNFEAPKGHRTHPMSDKVRGALFNILGDVDELALLDTYSGSGAIGIEALSRGAGHVTFIEVDAGAVTTIKHNVHQLGIDSRSKVIRANVAGWSANNPNSQFDVVVCDPPYDGIQAAKLVTLANHVKPGGIITYSLPPGTVLELPQNYSLLATKNYGDAELVFYRKTE